MEQSAKTSGRIPAILRILRLLLYAFGALSIVWFFFSFIGILIGVLFFLLMGDPSWRAHGIVLAASAATSEFVAHTATSLEPLHLAMRSGPVLLAAYLLLFLLVRLAWFSRRPAPWAAKLLEAGRSLWRRARVPLSVLLVSVPVGMWASVSINPGLLFDNSPRMLWVHAPSTAEPGRPFTVTVQAWDAYERLSAVYRGTVRFSLGSYDAEGRAVFPGAASLPESYTFTGSRHGSDMAYAIRDGKDNGSRRFSARIDSPGIHYLLVHDSVSRNTYYSNPIAVGQAGLPEPSRIFWGDIHSHSGLSDGTGSAAHSFFYARHVACLDFYALTDHGEIMMLIPGGFDRLEREANLAYDPHQFVTFPGVEWTQVKTGHYTCIFSGERLIKEPRLSYLTVPTIEGLWKALDAFTERAGCRALALPHHSTQNSYLQDWTLVNPKYVKLAEVTSVHGEFLFEQRHRLNYRGAIDPPPQYVRGSSIADALRMGKRLVLYAASDEHDGHPGHSLSHTAARVGHQRPMTRWNPRIGHPYPGGLTAVRASELTRDAVFSALEKGQVFACSDHGRPLLSFTLNGTPVGGEVPAAAGPRTVSVFLAQDGAPAAAKDTSAATAVRTSAEADGGWLPDWRADIEIIKNGELLAAIAVNGPVNRIEYVDRAPVSGASYGREECTEVDGRCYINRYSDNPVDPDTLNTGGADFYLVRVVGRNGRSGYAGPIWVQAAGPHPGD